MRLTPILATAAAISSVQAFKLAEARITLSDYANALKLSLPDYSNLLTRSPTPGLETRASCPAVWTSIVSDMSAMFIDKSLSPSQRNDDARAAIRVSFTLPPLSSTHTNNP